MGKKKRIFLGIAALLVLVITTACLWYARPLTIEELCPGLKLEESTGGYAVYSIFDDDDPNLQNVISLTPEDGLTPLLELFQGRQFRRSPFWWIPRGAKSQQTRSGVEEEFLWNIGLAFEDVTLPDGSIGSGYILLFDNFCGKLELCLDKMIWPVSTADQDQWLEDVLACILEADAKFDSNQ